MRHLYHPVMLDAGEHFCIKCRAINEQLAPTCAGVALSEEDHARRARENAMRYGVGRWMITTQIGEEVELSTLVKVGDTVAP
jgi:hypothetical protein